MLRILIADDHEVLRRGLLALLEQHADWHVIGEASNGREAVNLALKTRPDVALLDLFMPEMNGLEATQVIKKELPNTEVLIFTVHESEDSIRAVLAAGARGYLLKTELTHTVVAAIESVAEHKPFFSPQISKKLLDNYLQTQAVSAMSADPLTAREREVLQLLAEGRINKEVSALLGISEKTVETHRAAIMKKLEAKSVADLVRYAVRARIIEP
jgi:DNA-binding NarL/FixJ family response regulator